MRKEVLSGDGLFYCNLDKKFNPLKEKIIKKFKSKWWFFHIFNKKRKLSIVVKKLCHEVRYSSDLSNSDAANLVQHIESVIKPAKENDKEKQKICKKIGQERILFISL